MAYKIVSLSEVMAYEFSSIEGNVEAVSSRELSNIVPKNMSVSEMKDKIRQGHLLLLSDSPSTPLLLSEQIGPGQKEWLINSCVSDQFDNPAKNALLSRANFGGGSGSGVSSTVSKVQPLQQTRRYIPEPAKREDNVEKPKYELSVDIACSKESFESECSTSFSLRKTESEDRIVGFVGKDNKGHTRYTAETVEDEAKQLDVLISSWQLDISTSDTLKVRPIGSDKADIGYILVYPSLQAEERLTLPLEGYYYLFKGTEFIQEFKISEESAPYFFVTRSTSDGLNDDRKINVDRLTILVGWKSGDATVDDQYLVYLPKQISKEQLVSVSEKGYSFS